MGLLCVLGVLAVKEVGLRQGVVQRAFVPALCVRVGSRKVLARAMGEIQLDVRSDNVGKPFPEKVKDYFERYGKPALERNERHRRLYPTVKELEGMREFEEKHPHLTRHRHEKRQGASDGAHSE